MAELAAPAARQDHYYAQTARDYDRTHLAADHEHDLALAMLAGVARKIGARSLLDVGAGTGRALQQLEASLPGTNIVGLEPVDALRKVAADKGFGPDRMITGSGESLPFPDGAFDLVIETAVLHHVPQPGKVVGEMLRVARLGVMISDSNTYGQGGWLARRLKTVVDRLGLWRAMIWLQTRGRMWKWSEGDGLFYSYSVFDSLPQVAAKFPRVHLVNTAPMTGSDLRRGASQVCLIALADGPEQRTDRMIDKRPGNAGAGPRDDE